MLSSLIQVQRNAFKDGVIGIALPTMVFRHRINVFTKIN